MDILVMLEENPDHSPVLAHVNSVPSPLATDRPARDVVTLYGVPSPETLALALAAAVESHRTGDGHNNVRQTHTPMLHERCTTNLADLSGSTNTLFTGSHE